jgi:excisionase family DNA binding protein
MKSQSTDTGIVAAIHGELDLLTPDEASSLLKVPKGTLSVWRATNRVRLPFIKVGNAVRYRRADLAAFVQANVHASNEVAA